MFLVLFSVCLPDCVCLCRGRGSTPYPPAPDSLLNLHTRSWNPSTNKHCSISTLVLHPLVARLLNHPPWWFTSQTPWIVHSSFFCVFVGFSNLCSPYAYRSFSACLPACLPRSPPALSHQPTASLPSPLILDIQLAICNIKCLQPSQLIELKP